MENCRTAGSVSLQDESNSRSTTSKPDWVDSIKRSKANKTIISVKR